MKKIFTITCIMAIIFALTSFKPEGTEISVIINKDNPIAQLSAGEAKLFFYEKSKNAGQR